MTTTNVNTFFFTRTAPAKKMEVANALTEKELLTITTETIKRMVVEAGEKNKYSKSWNKYLYLDNVGNDWNSSITRVDAFVKKMTIDIYLQYENTDTTTTVELGSFLSGGDYHGSVLRSDRNGNPRTYYFNYGQGDKARFVRAIIFAFLKAKYSDKL